MAGTSVGPVYADGNNGTVKVDGDDITAGHDNDPHVSCSFSIEWFGFDAGSQSTVVTFAAQPPTGTDPPTGTGQLLTDTFSFTGSGSGNTLDAQKTYYLSSALSGYTLHSQGYHVDLTVNTTSSLGSDVKHKVFWVGPCTTPATPAPVTFSEVCGTANDTYTIPTTVGIDYIVNESIVAAGTYPATGTVAVTAVAQAGYTLTGTTSWNHTFTNDSCGGQGGQVLGETTTAIFTPGGSGAGQVLANTGSSTVISTLVALFLLIAALVVYAFNPKQSIYES